MNLHDDGEFPKSANIGQKLLESLPAILIALILGVGISYLLMASTNRKTQESMEAALSDTIAKADSDRKALEAELKKERAERVEAESKQKVQMSEQLRMLSDSLTAMTVNFDSFKEDAKTTDKRHTTEIASSKDDITSTKEVVHKIDNKMTYLEKRLEKVEALGVEVDALKGAHKELKDVQGALKNDYTELKGDLEAAKKKTVVTAQELADLDKRAQMFQLKVLAARAREAADAARQTDLKNLLNKLDDVEDK